MHDISIEIYLNTIHLNNRIINVLKKQSNLINITPTSISNSSFFLNLPEFTNLNTTLEIKDFILICNSKINSTNWNLLFNFSEKKLHLKYSDLSGISSIEKSFTTKEEIESFSLNQEALASIILPNKLYSFISKLDFQNIKLSVYKNSLFLKCEELESFYMKFIDLETQMENNEEITLFLDLKSVVLACNDFERQLICFFQEFVIFYSYHKDCIMANIIFQTLV